MLLLGVIALGAGFAYASRVAKVTTIYPNVTVNGVALPNTAAMPALPGWPAGRYIVQPGEVWLFSSYSAGSFDSRYFGPVVLASVRGIARPVAVIGDPAAITTGVTKQ